MARRVVFLKRIQRFRSGAYVWLALLLTLLAQDAEPPVFVWAGVVVFPTIPWLLVYAGRHRRIADDVENVVTPLFVALLVLPLLPCAAVIGALMTGAVAQRGWHGLPRCMVLLTTGWCVGTLLAPDIDYRPNRLADVLCLAFMAFYATPLCALGYEETMRMHRLREGLRVVSVDLERQRDRLSRYVAAPVAERLAEPVATKVPLQRRWLTVAFVDIADFTALTERLEPEDLTMLLDEFFAALADLSLRNGGSLHKFLGDGALISFGESRRENRRDDARACVAMLGQLGCVMDRLNAFSRSHGIPATLTARAGAASGYCSVGDFGADERIEYTMIGAPVNLASRLEGLAGAGEAWVSQSTCDLAGAESFEPLGAFSIRGFDEPIHAFRLRVAAAVDGSRAAI
jgi:class 3 adenylate cyclase